MNVFKMIKIRIPINQTILIRLNLEIQLTIKMSEKTDYTPDSYF